MEVARYAFSILTIQHVASQLNAARQTMQRKHVTVCALCVCKLYTVRTECMMMMINCACENYGFVRCKLVYNRINNMLYISFGAFRSTIVAGICDSALRLFHCMSVELHICAL